jgi:hypothetical protein
LAIRPNKFLVFEWRGPKQFKLFISEADPLTGVLVFFILCNGEVEPCMEVYLVHSGWRSSREWEEARQWFDRAWVNALAEREKYVRQRVD